MMRTQLPPLTSCGTVLEESVELDILGMIFAAKITIEKHLRSASSPKARCLEKVLASIS